MVKDELIQCSTSEGVLTFGVYQHGTRVVITPIQKHREEVLEELKKLATKAIFVEDLKDDRNPTETRIALNLRKGEPDIISKALVDIGMISEKDAAKIGALVPEIIESRRIATEESDERYIFGDRATKKAPPTSTIPTPKERLQSLTHHHAHRGLLVTKKGSDYRIAYQAPLDQIDKENMFFHFENDLRSSSEDSHGMGFRTVRNTLIVTNPTNEAKKILDEMIAEQVTHISAFAR